MEINGNNKNQFIKQNQFGVLDVEPNHEVLTDDGMRKKHQPIPNIISQNENVKRNGLVIDPFPERNLNFPVPKNLTW